MKCIKNSLTRWVSVLGVLVASMNGLAAPKVFIDHCSYGCPVSAAVDATVADTTVVDATIVVQHIFAASIADNGLAQWVAYRVFDATIGVASLLPRYWRADRLIADTSAAELEADAPRFLQPELSDSQDSDYRITEVTLLNEDRGRLAPVTSFAGTPYWEELNLLTNMSPMPAALRLGPWSRLDQVVNEATAQSDQFFIVSGPITRSANNQSLQEPAAFYKLIVSGDRIAAFYFPSDTQVHTLFCDYQSNLANIQRATDLDFYPEFRGQWQEDLAADFGCQ